MDFLDVFGIAVLDKVAPEVFDYGGVAADVYAVFIAFVGTLYMLANGGVI